MTGNRVLLDTSIIINSFKNNDVKRQLHGFSEIYVPVIAAGELYYGAYRSANIKKHLEQVYLFLQNYTLLSADDNNHTRIVLLNSHLTKFSFRDMGSRYTVEH